jgi:ribosomal protein S18 acetylase RimI-like enzyme
MMKEMEAQLKRLGCPKVNLQVRTTNAAVIEFYQQLGYRMEDRVSFGKRLE